MVGCLLATYVEPWLFGTLFLMTGGYLLVGRIYFLSFYKVRAVVSFCDYGNLFDYDSLLSLTVAILFVDSAFFTPKSTYFVGFSYI